MMRRWLKEKKRDKRSNSLGFDEDGQDDDYGFINFVLPGTDRNVPVAPSSPTISNSNKSPQTRRQLPPTPLTPEEKSPHIYEEIHDLQTDGRNRNPPSMSSAATHPTGRRATYGPGTLSSSTSSYIASSGTTSSTKFRFGKTLSYDPSSNPPSSKGDSINPYLVVPVDKEVRQTPINFHRDGTPEVHCDVIVKETHCEILLSRKPKVGAFNIESKAGSNNVGGVPNNDQNNVHQTVRNNTHFCSQNRRASIDAPSLSNRSLGSSSGPWNSSAFSSSTSRVNSLGISAASLSSQSEQRLPTLHDDNGSSSGSSAKGIVTYSVGGSCIPRGTKLTFKPLKPLDGDDTSLSNIDPFFSMVPPPEGIPITVTLHNRTSVSQDNGLVIYSSIPNPNSPQQISNTSLQNNSKSPHDPEISKQNPSNVFDNPISPTMAKRNISLTSSETHVPLLDVENRAPSPSAASTCTYASVSFPVEPKIYNTIKPDIISQETTRQQQSYTTKQHLESFLESDTESIRYSCIQDATCKVIPNTITNQISATNISNQNGATTNQEPIYEHVVPPNEITGNNENTFSSGSRLVSIEADNCQPVGILNTLRIDNQNDMDNVGMDYTSGGVIYSDIVNEQQANNTTIYAFINPDTTSVVDDLTNTASIETSVNLVNSNVARANNNLDTSEADVDRLLYGQNAGTNLLLDFCTCPEDHHSTSCAFIEDKADDDTSSIATSINEIRSSCSGCGRLIRQITYSESFSDETYEHVYSSRLLLRRGRRYSSPDITVSEMSTPNTYQTNPAQISRDDLWTPRSSENDILSINKQTEIQNQSTFRQLLNKNSNSQKVGTDNIHATSTSNSAFDPISKHDLKSEIKQPSPISAASNPLTKAYQTDSSPQTSSTVQQQTKSKAFSSLFAKFSRPKPKSNKTDNTSVENCTSPDTTKPANDSLVAKQEKTKTVANNDGDDVSHIPAKNTTKLSQLFQRLSVNDDVGMDVKSKDKFKEENPSLPELSIHIPENEGMSSPKLLKSPQNSTITSTEYKLMNPSSKNSSPALTKRSKQSPTAIGVRIKDTMLDATTPQPNSDFVDNDAIISKSKLKQSVKNTTADENVNANTKLSNPATLGVNGEQSTTKTEDNATPQTKTKTDSGDTCYEYDISTSSEGEQTSYDCFMSNVKKSLGLELEAQQIADMNAKCRKMFCKKCKKADIFVSENDDNDSVGSDQGCPHISAKFGDLRKIFGDFIVDQRAAILDCLTDFAHCPFSVKGDGRDNVCRGCGGEIITSDSESITTVYSILSQQFRMTSPGTHTPSCDSDEGTMADNSCESADEVSSGYDEAIAPGTPGEHVSSHKSKRKEKTSRDKKEKKSHHHTYSSITKDQTERIGKRNHSFVLSPGCKQTQNLEVGGMVKNRGKGVDGVDYDYTEPQQVRNSSVNNGEVKAHDLLSNQSNELEVDCLLDEEQYGDSASLSSPNKYSVETKAGNSKSHHDKENKNINSYESHRNKRRQMANEKVIQDIYLPLPSKALAWLTARNCCNHGNDNQTVTNESTSCFCVSVQPNSNADELISNVALDSKMTQIEMPTPIPSNMNSNPCNPSHFQEASLFMKVPNTQATPENSLNVQITKQEIVKSGCELSHTLENVKVNSKVKDVTTNFCFLSSETDFSDDKNQTVLSDAEKRDGKNNKNCDIEQVVGVQKRNLELKMDNTNQFSAISQSHLSNQPVTVGKDVVMAETRQKQKEKQMAALDLLPETILGSDADDVTRVYETMEAKPPTQSHRPKSKMVERLAKLFEDNAKTNISKTSVISNENRRRSSNSNNVYEHCPSKTPIINSNIGSDHPAINNTSSTQSLSPSSMSSTPNTTSLLPSSSPILFRQRSGKQDKQQQSCPIGVNLKPPRHPVLSTTSTSNLVTKPHSVCQNKTHSIGPSQSINKIEKNDLEISPQNKFESPSSPVAKHNQHYVKNRSRNSRRCSSLNRFQKEKSDTDTESQLDYSEKHRKPRMKRTRSRENKNDDSYSIRKENNKVSEDQTPSRSRNKSHNKKDHKLLESSFSVGLAPAASPTPSSSSSSSKRKGHGGKQKKLSKKGHPHRRTNRSKSERRHNSKSHREERTRYYFSSDLSDIDVVEVENWETYSSGSIRHGDRVGGLKNSKIDSGNRKTENDPSLPSNRKLKSTHHSVQKQDNSDSDHGVIHEVYSIPPNSSEVRTGVSAISSNSVQDGISTVAALAPSSETEMSQLTAASTSGGSRALENISKPTKAKKRDVIYKMKKNTNQLLSDLIIRNYDRQMYESDQQQ